MNAGDTLLIALPDASVDSHMWMVISDPAQSDDVLIVNFTSWRADKDQACILDRGDHPYISRKTCINFKDAKVCKAENLDKLIDAGQMKSLEPLSTDILRRIRDSVADSRISQDNAQFLVDQGLVEF